jgi:hypothetical protein
MVDKKVVGFPLNWEIDKFIVLFLENLLIKKLWDVRTAETSTKTIRRRDIGGYIFIELILF